MSLLAFEQQLPNGAVIYVMTTRKGVLLGNEILLDNYRSHEKSDLILADRECNLLCP